MRFLFNFASRSRPDNFFRGVKSIIDNFSDENTFEVIGVFDYDDESMKTHEVYSTLAELGDLVDPCWGYSSGKIDAINRECENFGDDWSILINMSDDMVFTKKDFDKDIVDAMPEDLDGYLHFRDTNHRQIDALTTLHIVGKKYFDRDRFIYHPAYESVFCDNFNDALAKKRGKYKFIPTIIFNHLHPIFGKAPMDDQYKKTEDKKVYKRDLLTYRKMFRNIKQYL